MKVVIFLVSLVLFLASFLAFGYASTFEGLTAAAVFFGGILLASIAFVIPFHLLEKFD
ncbi:hypothetical protein [Protaetiibacter larvae]|uniref:hypothetical protein n=1 Tax=Protaetiibacter larvae TaxID=2592654 RepID=UPI00143D92B0|nr:hypothetical protein [Protaetiibacter larvae]